MTHNIIRFLGGVLILGLVSGCGKNTAPPPVDQKDARDGLTTALEAWKRGDSQSSLAQLSPSIEFVDPSWEKGFRLMNFKILPNEEWEGRMARLTVKLSLKNKDGEESEREITYTVDAQPRMVSIVYNDWDVD